MNCSLLGNPDKQLRQVREDCKIVKAWYGREGQPGDHGF